MLTSGCPCELHFEESNASKLRMMKGGQPKKFNQHPDQAAKIINKEDRNSHILPLHDWVCQLGSNMRHTVQGMVIKDEKGRVVWDGTTKIEYWDTVMNDYTSIDNEAEITFGTAKMEFYWLIYNMRVSFPEASIFLALADVKACFRFPRIHPDLAGAFGFLVANFCCLVTAMIFWLEYISCLLGTILQSY